MKLFHETQNSIYLFLLENIGLNNLTWELFNQEIDFEIIEDKFKNFSPEYLKMLNKQDIPILLTDVEKKALAQLSGEKYISEFLDDKTILKLKNMGIESCWDKDSIILKNQQKHEVKSNNFKKLLHAIKNKRMISYYAKSILGKPEKKAVPFKLGYSLVKNKFWVFVYDPISKKYHNVLIDSMENLTILEKYNDNFEYRDYLKTKRKEIILRVDNTEYIIERFLRVFSYYEKEVEFNENYYEVKLIYYKFDEKEIMKDIMSFGKYLVVLKPESIKREIINRIQWAIDNYEK